MLIIDYLLRFGFADGIRFYILSIDVGVVLIRYTMALTGSGL